MDKEEGIPPHQQQCTHCQDSCEAVRWHPAIPVPVCLDCDAASTQTLLALYRHHRQQQEEQTVCIWCLRAIDDPTATPVLRCATATAKHPTHVVFCQACLETHFDAATTVASWRAHSDEGRWACLMCDKVPLLELGLEKGWGLPQYPQDLRMSAEIQEALGKVFATPHPKRRLGTLFSSSSSSFASSGGRKRPRAAHTTTTTNPRSPLPSLSPPLTPQAAAAPDWPSLAAGCEDSSGLVVLVEQTQQALSLLTRLWREAAVQVAAREDILDMGPGLTREMVLMQEGRMAEGEGLRRRPTIEYLTRTVSQSSGEGNGKTSPDLMQKGGGTTTNIAEKEAQQAVRNSLAELRVLLRQMRLMGDQKREGGGGGGRGGGGGGYLEYEAERMGQLHAWLLSSQGVLRSLHTQVIEVLTRAQSNRSQSSSSSSSSSSSLTSTDVMEVESTSSGEEQQREEEEEAEEEVAFRRRLRASGESLQELERDLSERLEDVSFAVSILCQMKGDAEEEEEEEEKGKGKKEGVHTDIYGLD